MEHPVVIRAKASPEFILVGAGNASAGKLDRNVLRRVRRQAAKSGYDTSDKWKKAPKAPKVSKITKGSPKAPAKAPGRKKMVPQEEAQVSVPLPVVRSPPCAGYEAVRVLYDIDIADLSGLADLQVGRISHHLLRSDPTRLPVMLRQKGWSYLSYLPTWYGVSECLDDAIHCLAARISAVTSSRVQDTMAIRLYGKALRSLQQALDDDARYRHTDVLCATRILSLFEMLGTQQMAWIQHNSGSARLIEARGPEYHNSDFDLLLFKTQAMTIAIEDMFRPKKSFFEESKWQDFFVEKSATELDGAWWSAFAFVGLMPGILSEISAILRTPISQSEYTTRLERLQDRCRSIRGHALAWHINWQRDDASSSLVQKSNDQLRLEDNWTNILMLSTRFLTITLPEGEEYTRLESESQELAANTIKSIEESSRSDPTSKLGMLQKILVAYGIAATKGVWKSAVSNDLPWEERKNALRERWDTYSAHRWVLNISSVSDMEQVKGRVIAEA